MTFVRFQHAGRIYRLNLESVGLIEDTGQRLVVTLRITDPGGACPIVLKISHDEGKSLVKYIDSIARVL